MWRSWGAGREVGGVSEQALVRTASRRTHWEDDVIGGDARKGGAWSETPRKLRRVRVATLPVLLALGAVLVGCSDGQAHRAAHAGASATPTPPPTYNFDHQPIVTEPAYNYSGEQQEVEIG